MLTQEALKRLLNYDPEKGIFTWLYSNRAHAAGKIAGGDGTGGMKIHVLGRQYKAHRLAWLYVHGVWPTHNIDHINGDWRDNRIANLRDVPQRVNVQNQRRPRSDSRTGFLGVRKNGSNWMAVIQKDRKQHYLGTFITKEQAHGAYLHAKRVIHEGCQI